MVYTAGAGMGEGKTIQLWDVEHLSRPSAFFSSNRGRSGTV